MKASDLVKGIAKGWDLGEVTVEARRILGTQCAYPEYVSHRKFILYVDPKKISIKDLAVGDSFFIAAAMRFIIIHKRTGDLVGYHRIPEDEEEYMKYLLSDYIFESFVFGMAICESIGDKCVDVENTFSSGLVKELREQAQELKTDENAGFVTLFKSRINNKYSFLPES